MQISYSFTGAGSNVCSGACKYCSASSSMNYSQFDWTKRTDKDKIIDAIIKADKLAYEQFKADFNKVEETLDNDPQIKNVFEARKRNPAEEVIMNVDLWLCDPLTCKSALQEMLDFLQDYCVKRCFILKAHTSTNGLPLIIDEYAEWLIENKVGLQLSHDGLGQWMRTQDIDPMTFENTKALIKCGTLNWINATLNFWNSSLYKNIDYFTEHLKSIFPLVYDKNKCCTEEDDRVFRSLFIKLNHIYDSKYDIKAKNEKGLFNGKEYETLKNQPIGDLAFRNDYELARLYNIPELGHVLDNHIAEWDRISYDVENPSVILLPFVGYLTNQMNRNKYYKSHDELNSGACRVFQKGLKDTTFVIDTLGNYSQCNLIDSEHKVENPECKQPAMCKGCKFEFSEACNGCGSVMPRQNDCHYLYAWNEFIERYSKRKQNERTAIKRFLAEQIVKI